jgi:hypothetical protein
MTVYISGTTGYSGPVGVLGDLTTTGNTILGDQSTDTLNVANGNLILDASGDLGLGVTPAAWVGYKVMQSGIASFAGGSSGAYLLQDNAYTDNSGASWKYINSSYAAAQYYAASGAHIWRIAPSGTAGNAITFTQAMTLSGTSTNATLKLSNGTTGSGAGDGFDLIMDGTDAYVWNRENAPILFGTNNAERARIDSSGNFGIGTASPNQKLYVVGNGLFDGGFTYWTATGSTPGSTAPAIWSPASGVMGLWTNGAERARINSSGDFLVGTTSNIGAGAKTAIYSGGNVLHLQSTSGAANNLVSYNSGGSATFTVSNGGAVSASGTVSAAGLNSTADIILSSGGKLNTVTGSGSCDAAGQLLLNLEATAGLYTCGLLIIRGNENGINQTIRIYMWNISYYSPDGSRSVGLKILNSQTLNNGYGDVYAYLSNYSGSYTTADQTNSGTTSAASNVFIRNAVGAGCTYSYTFWRAG